METKTISTSERWRLDFRDIGKGFVVAVVSGFIMAVIETLSTGKIPTMPELRLAGITALSGGLSYLLKNFVQPSQTIIQPAATVVTVKTEENNAAN